MVAKELICVHVSRLWLYCRRDTGQDLGNGLCGEAINLSLAGCCSHCYAEDGGVGWENMIIILLLCPEVGVCSVCCRGLQGQTGQCFFQAGTKTYQQEKCANEELLKPHAAP